MSSMSRGRKPPVGPPEAVKGSSDDDPGYLWGEAGKAKVERLEKKANSGYRMWEREKGRQKK